MQAWVFRGLWGPGCCACDVFARQLDSDVAAAVALHARPVALAAGLQRWSPVMAPRQLTAPAPAQADAEAGTARLRGNAPSSAPVDGGAGHRVALPPELAMGPQDQLQETYAQVTGKTR